MTAKRVERIRLIEGMPDDQASAGDGRLELLAVVDVRRDHAWVDVTLTERADT